MSVYASYRNEFSATSTYQTRYQAALSTQRNTVGSIFDIATGHNSSIIN
jgi:hypothetical protein